VVINDVAPIAFGEWSAGRDTRAVRCHERGRISPSLHRLSLDHPTGYVARRQVNKLNKFSFHGKPAQLSFVS